MREELESWYFGNNVTPSEIGIIEEELAQTRGTTSRPSTAQRRELDLQVLEEVASSLNKGRRKTP